MSHSLPQLHPGRRVDADAPRPAWFLWAVVLLLVAVYAPTVHWLWGRWTLSVWHNAHGLFIPPIVAYFVWTDLKAVRHLPASSSAWGFAFLIPALLLHVLDTGLHTQLLSAVSMVIAAPGLSLLFLGPERTKKIAFPLAFLAFMIPIPLALTAHLHMVLRQIATWATANLMPMLGIPVYVEGTTLHIANGTLEIADACSGFSTLYASMATAFLCAYACRDWRQRLLVLVAAAPIAILANIVRVVLLSVLARTQGFDILQTWVHPATGMLTFVLALPAIFWLGKPWEQKAGR
jgi:exosortase